MRKISWGVMAALAAIIALYAIAVLVVPPMRPPFLQQRFLMMPVAATLHLAASAVALLAGALQHNATIRGRFLNFHRWTGRTYVVAVFLGGTAAFALATASQYGLPTHVGFGLLAALWLTATGMAYWRIRAGDQSSHQRWMIRSYALTFAAVMLRIYLPVSQMVGIPFEPAYQTIAWLCWVPNLVVAEWLILQRGEAVVAPDAEAVVL